MRSGLRSVVPRERGLEEAGELGALLAGEENLGRVGVEDGERKKRFQLSARDP